MSEINWCLKQKFELKLVERNENLAKAYLKMAEDSLGTMNREKDKNIVFGVSACYYSMYYSLYAVMQKIGIKCEIHSCSIAFARKFLSEFYDADNVKLIELAFSLRNDFQYYVNRSVDKSNVAKILDGAYGFFVKSRDVLSRVSDAEIKKIRRENG